MNRRHFLIGTASGVAAFTGLVNGQAPAAAGGQAPAAGGRGGGIPPEKLARISMMTLNHSALFKTPWAQNPTERQTITTLDIPQYYVDTYGVRHVEFQHSHIAQDTTNPDVAFFRELKAKFDAAGSKAVQVNVEIGQMTVGSPNGPQALSGDARATWLATAKKWVDAAPVLGIERLMWNQTGLNDMNKVGVISLWKELQDYAKPKGIKISNEMRGGGPVAGDGKPPNQAPAVPGAPGRGNRGTVPPGTPANAPGPVMTGMKHAQLLQEAAAKSGGYTNLDFGGNTRFLNQDELHSAIKMMLKTNSGQMHIKSCENWDIGLAVKYAESQGYRGLYTIEVNPNNAITVVIASIVSML